MAHGRCQAEGTACDLLHGMGVRKVGEKQGAAHRCDMAPGATILQHRNMRRLGIWMRRPDCQPAGAGRPLQCTFHGMRCATHSEEHSGAVQDQPSWPPTSGLLKKLLFSLRKRFLIWGRGGWGGSARVCRALNDPPPPTGAPEAMACPVFAAVRSVMGWSSCRF